MKNAITSSFTVVLLIVTTLFSCSSEDVDDNLIETNTLVGEWQRLDSNASVVNTFEFYADNSGVKIYAEYHDDGTATSSATGIEWNTTSNNIQLLMDEEINTPYSFNAEGQLILSAISEIPFVRID
jgi:hypothetical protein